MARALDLLAEGRHKAAADVLAQRFKALEKCLEDHGSWARAELVELVDIQSGGLIDEDEAKLISQQLIMNKRLERGGPQWGDVSQGAGPRGDRVWNPFQKRNQKGYGKGDGKNKGKKGKGKGQDRQKEKDGEMAREG